ncbi:MAG: LysR family transcriptional regulator [Methylacidiphilales bacterium]|nr:LysR family transcriptional regulator [Candidatus Methylacidiphilales bacterium]MDW8349585.1 LysR family transcriptional regulator [Verrucomicrobiae bacterium]
MQIEACKIFRDLVDTKSFSKAAAHNSITQSAVSQQLRALEARFQVPLLERSSKRFALTREGELFYQAARRIIKEYTDFCNVLSELRKVVSGSLRVATVYSIGLHELPPYLKKFLREYPQVKVHVEYRRSNQVYDDVLEGASDIGLVAYPTGRKSLKIEPFREDRLVVICAPQHPLSKHQEITLSALRPYKLIGFEPDIPTRRAVDKILRAENIEIQTVMEFDNIETVKRAVEIDAGIAIVPRATVEQEAKNGTLHIIEFKGKPYYRPLGIIYLSGRVLSPAMRKFIETLQGPAPVDM